MRKTLYKQLPWILCFSGSVLWTNPSFSEQKSISPQEALVLRRITEFWKDGDYATVKKQIADFLTKHPETSLRDHLHALLADLYFQEKSYKQALGLYVLIESQELREKTFFNQLQALFETKEYEKVSALAEEYLKSHQGMHQDQEFRIRFLLAEAFFRRAALAKDPEEKISFLKMAKPHYKILSQTKYADKILFPLAEVHRLLKEDERAAELYTQLAERYPNYQEKFFFQAAILQIKDNPKEAIRLFAKVYDMNGRRAPLAAFNQLVLLFQTEQLKDFLPLYERSIDKMPQEKATLLKYYYGRTCYTFQDYKNAAEALENFVQYCTSSSKEFKTALLVLVNCSRHLNDLALNERALHYLKQHFNKDEDLPKALLVHAQMCRENGDVAQALKDLKVLLSDFPNDPNREDVFYDYALLLSTAKKWSESREVFLSFIEKYPQSERISSSWRHLINCCVEELKDPAATTSTETKETFAWILESALRKDNVFNGKEKDQYQIVLIKCLFDLGKYEQAIPLLDQYIADHSEDTSLAEPHMLMALCLQKTKNDEALFIAHAEKALSLNSEISEKDSLHLELYNAYLTQSLHEQDFNYKTTFLEKAADHLFSSLGWQEKTIKLDNFLWLANFYYKKAKDSQLSDQKALDRAHVLYSHLLGWNEEQKNSSLEISSESLFLENEVLKFVDLLGLEKETKKQIHILEALVRKQQDHPELPWKLQKRAILQLGEAYENYAQYENARKTYQYLIKTSENINSAILHAAHLRLSRLDYRLMPQDQKNLDNPQLISILHTLKDLQIQKKLQTEPTHLEAAIQYCEIRSELADVEVRIKTELFFLKRIKDDFTSLEDPIALEYNNMRTDLPEKDRIFQSYMSYIDAKMIQLEAENLEHQQRVEEAQALKEQASLLYDELLNSPDALYPYLQDRIKRNKGEIVNTLY